MLSRDQAQDYPAACAQPWRGVTTVILGTKMRPGEAYKLRSEHILLNGKGRMIQITKGKPRAARRLLPMIPAACQALKARHEGQRWVGHQPKLPEAAKVDSGGLTCVESP